jgi:hypothetical protein
LASPDRTAIVSINPNGTVQVDAFDVGLGGAGGTTGTRFDLIYSLLGYYAPTFDPGEEDGSITPASLDIVVAAICLFVNNLVTGITTHHSAAFASTVTTYYWGLYDVNGNQLGVTANRNAGADTGTGRKSFDLISPVTAASTGVYYLVKTSDHAGAGASYPRLSISTVNDLAAASIIASGKVRAGTAGSGSTLPATITIPTTASTVGIMWAACY